MKNQRVERALLLALALAFSFSCGNVAAKSSQPPQGSQSAPAAETGQLSHVFTLTTSSAATYSNPSGALEPMPGTSLPVAVQAPSLLTISFSPAAPSSRQVAKSSQSFLSNATSTANLASRTQTPFEFLYPQFCCDTRAFHWAVPNVEAGAHTVEILWGMGNPTSADVSNRTLIVESATL